LVSFWLGVAWTIGPRTTDLRESAAASRVLVTESVPRDFDARSWPRRAQPGRQADQVFESASPTPREEFIARWHG